MQNGMSRNVYNSVYKNRNLNLPKQATYRDIILLEAEKTSKRKFEINSKRTAVIKIKRNK